MLQIYYLKVPEFQCYPEEYFLPYINSSTWEATRSYRNDRVRRTKLLGETMVRTLFRRIWGIKTVDCHIAKGPHGKPYISEQELSIHFNISHSGDYIVCAVSDQEVGIDIERRGKVRLNVADRFFHPREVEILAHTPQDKQKELFFNYWAVKESYLKFTGEGLSCPLSSFEVCFSNQGVALKKEHSPLPVSVRECPIDKDYSSFVCCRCPDSFTITPFTL